MRKMTWIGLPWIVAATMVFGITHARAGVNFNDFSSTAGLQLNGNAAQAGTALRIVPAALGNAGSAFTTSTQNISSFSTSFKFQITNSVGGGGEGITFTIQGAGPGALGSNFEGLGYQGITNSVSVEFDTINNAIASDPDSNHVGVNSSGNVVSVATAPVAPQFDNTSIWYAWIDYDGTTLEVRTNTSGTRPALANLSHAINIGSIVGPNAYVGFTGGTGFGNADHDLHCWTFDSPNSSPDCTNAVPSVATLWPPNHKFVPVSIAGVTDANGDPVTITIESIFQDERIGFPDEPTEPTGQGSGNTSPDAIISGETASVRAERNGNSKSPGDGRVYHIRFTASDGEGGFCSGEVTVCVPHDQDDANCVDGGALFDSTSP